MSGDFDRSLFIHYSRRLMNRDVDTEQQFPRTGVLQLDLLKPYWEVFSPSRRSIRYDRSTDHGPAVSSRPAASPGREATSTASAARRIRNSSAHLHVALL